MKMSNDSSDSSDTNFRPTGNRGRQQNRSDQKRKRRIVMRIEFDDSDESTSTSDRTSDDEDDVKNKNGGNNIGGNNLGDDGPSCSGKLRSRQEEKSMGNDAGNDYDDDSDDFQRNAAARRLRRGGRRINVLDVGISDGSSSGSEITPQKSSRVKKYILSEDELETRSPSKNCKTNDSYEENQNQKQMDEQGFTSDSSSNDLLEKCPICLLTFRQQEIGSPSTCQHIFCANCIEAWSKNVQTCPIDRIEFKRIIVRESFDRRNIVREINVDPNAKKDLAFEDELVEEEDVTNCEICSRPDREDVMLLCDHCNQGYHMDCLSPPLSEVPEGSWYCDNCVDSQDEEDDEDLHMLYEDIRDMGIPESRLRVREVHQPRILRTRQNERIRAAIIRRTRAVIGRTETTTMTATTNSSSTQRGRSRTTMTSISRRSASNKKRSAVGSAVRKSRKRKTRRARQRTYVVEYDLNSFDEKFAIKTTKKVIKRSRRRLKAKSSKRGKKKSAGGLRMTASKRLAEQMGVKHDPKYSSHFSRSAGGLSLFGNANDLEYFSDSDDNNAGNIESEIHIETGHGTAVQTSVRISNYGSQRSRKSILLGRQPNRGIQDPVVDQNNHNPDILSSILSMQDRWHSATRNLESVHINSDGTLNLPTSTTPSASNAPSVPESIAKDGKSVPKQSTNGPSSNDINQAPMYSRGGGTPNFNRGGGGYNNRSNNSNQNSYRGGGGGNQYRHSTSGAGNSAGFGGSSASSSGGMNFNMVGRGNFNFSNNPNYVGLQGQQNNASPFQQRNFNQRNQQNQQQTQNNQRNNITITQQRHSLPFTSNRNDNIQQQQQNLINSFGGGMPQTCLPPPHLILNQQSQQNHQTSMNENSLFGGLPPPMSVPPLHMNLTPVRMSVPPPPTPPAVVIPPAVNSSLFQLNSDYGNNDDDSNCPNFSIYSQESLQVAKSSEAYADNTAEGTSSTVNVSKEDDENEDLVQLDDDDEIPMPPEPKSTENAGSSELYEPENPTEENDYDDQDDEKNNENQLKGNDVKVKTKDDGDDYDDGDKSSDDEDEDKKKKNKGEEQAKHTNSEKYDPEEDAFSECSNNNGDEEVKQKETGDLHSSNDIDKELETVRSPSPAVSDIRLPESETAAANRKGVLELYDDSDWEELDIDRPKEINNKGIEKVFEKETAADDENVNEQDRSYTPCLDENIDPEEHENQAGSTTPLIGEKAMAVEAGKKDEKSNSNVENMETELISDEEDVLDRPNKDRKKNQKGGDKRGDRRDNQKIEKFKKIGNKQKGRNYRGDKQPVANNRRGDKKRKSRSFSRSRSRSRSIDSFNSRGGRSRSRSPRFRSRGDRSRSRSRSNNKENQGRWSGNFRDGGRFNKNSGNQNNRLKRRELPRYDVRNVVGHHTPPKTVVRDRYGRDTSRNRRSTRSLSRGRRGPPPRSPFSRSRSRNRRLSISLSPSPPYNRRRSLSHPRPARNFSPARRRSTSVGRRTPPYRQRSRSPLRVMRSRSISRGSEYRFNARKEQRHLRAISPVKNISRGRIRSRSLSMSPRYTPRLSRSRSKTPRPKGRKKKGKDARKKKSKKRIATISPSPNRRISRQTDPFEIEKPPKKKKRRTPRAKSPIHDDHGWSPSPSPPPQPIVDNYEYPLDKNVSWTPPMQSPLVEVFRPNDVRSVSRTSRKDKNKRNKKKKKNEKRRDGRKEKKRKRRTETPEPAPSKEVFASGNNILVSVSFNKETTTNQQQHTQQTIVTLPPNREDLLSNRRPSVDRVVSNCAPSKKRRERRKKIDIKPVAIIDLERSPFQVEQEPTDVIVLTDSEEALEREQREHRRDRCRSESSQREVDTESHRNQRSGVSGGQRGEKTPEHLDTIHEESYDLPQSGGPKTPPEPPIVKFNLQAKKQSKVRNPLHDENDDIPSDTEINERQKQQQQENHRSDLDAMHAQSNQKIGPNTPPESGPCSPDAYDPFEPTKSPSISPRSPTPPPSQLDAAQNAICVENAAELGSNQKHLTVVDSEQRREQIPGLGGNVTQGASINPVDLVMALINAKSTANSTQDLVNKSNESQHNMGGLNSHDDSFRDKAEEGNVITVLSNLLITSGSMQHIPSISSPTPPAMSKKILPGLPKIGGSVGGSSSSGVNMRNGGGTSNNADDSFNINDIESPYSPGSADYEDLFEPPPDTNKRRSKRSGAAGGKPEVFDNLFGSSSPVGNVRLPSYNPSKKYKGASATAMRKSKIKVGKSSDDNVKIYDDVPSSAVELHVKDKFLRKLNRQERVVDEVKLVLKPRFNRKQITKEDYKEIMRRAVPKICHSRSGEIDPFKIKKLIEAYVKKFRAKHKKLNIVNTGQVSSAVKCAAYLKKL